MPRNLAALLLFLSASALLALPPVPKRSTEPATPLVLQNGRTLWVKSLTLEGEAVASGRVFL